MTSVRHRRDVSSQDEVESIASSNILISPARSIRRHTSTYIEAYPESENTRFISFNYPKRVFRWIYSFSLVLLMLLTLAFVAVTPIDVIVQTSESSYSGIKMFIVIIVCVVFLVVALIIYFLRIFQNRVSLNDIPSKSVYIPFEGDMLASCVKAIDAKLKECVSEIKVKAGPLYNEKIIINHPGMSPPEYVQRRNISGTGEGSLLPPNACYEDVIRSLGVRFKLDGRVLTQVDLPMHLSLREIILFLSEKYLNDPNTDKKQVPNLKLLIESYEKFKFGPDLIDEGELLNFIIEFDKLGQFFQNNVAANFSKPTKRTPGTRSYYSDTDMLEQSLFGAEASSRSAFHYYYSDREDNYEENAGADNKLTTHKAPKDKYFKNLESSDQLNPLNRNLSSTSFGSWSSPSLKQPRRRQFSTSSNGSSKSVIKNRLAIPNSTGSDHFNEMKYTGDAESNNRRYSGYISDSENELNYQ
ncbi:uncharacterized protein AC631_05311 [Debaryomyces fabryi]|uniref:Defect at low temperature protein 1 n=1 Tax=Debaryomyces fabryi TaxID=58627 RepID=A0A0V1PRQ7_9ASCO|nr:uncharacterized protein AC631_05311 [Debaryomyces fabryi]KRZ98924.1 hypothetical protein AC631_05311 [Debaryomyces fabryi]CUM46717.1 unnamed protein product [Debaryomyces fabryi]